MSRIADYDYTLPESAIAQVPVEPRDASRLLVLNKDTGDITHDTFSNLGNHLDAGDLLVMNNTRVTALRLFGQRDTGGKVEALVFDPFDGGLCRALLKPAKRLQVGAVVRFGPEQAEVTRVLDSGVRELRFDGPEGLEERLRKIGEVPLPPYIHSRPEDDERYQTVYSRAGGSSAAPTAGLHFTPSLLNELRSKGVEAAEVTLDVGTDTFRPIQGEDTDGHVMRGERYSVPLETARAIYGAKGRIIAVGTTTTRTLETSAVGKRQVRHGTGCSSLFIQPGYEFQIVDGLLTNFHMPRTTMLLMVAAICGRERLMRAYSEALTQGYRFLSFGDSMLVIGEKQ